MRERTIYDVMEDIVDTYFCELVASNVSDDVLDILHSDLCMELEKVLEKVKMYSKKINNQ